MIGSVSGKRGYRVAQLSIGLVLVAALAGCTQDLPLPGSVTPPSAPSGVVDAGRDATASCEEIYDFRQENPQVVVALDRSASMWQKYNGSAFTRLEETQRTLRRLMATYHAAVHIGYVEFPASECPAGSSAACCASNVILPGRDTASAIQRRWDCTAGSACSEAESDAPASLALRNVRERFAMLDAAISSRHVFLLTDSEPACSGRQSMECSQSIAEAGLLWGNELVETEVYALADELRVNSCLQMVAGVRMDSANPSAFHMAVNPDTLTEQLEERLAALSRKACTFRLPSALRPPDYLVVSLGDGTTNMVVPQDRSNGWDFEPESVRRFTFHGPLCEALRTSQVEDVDVKVCTPERGKNRRR
jgi:hypothetical protein